MEGSNHLLCDYQRLEEMQSLKEQEEEAKERHVAVEQQVSF